MTLIPLRPKLLRRDHLQVLMVAMEAIQEQLDSDFVLRAAAKFFQRRFDDSVELERYLHDEDAHSQFFPWLLWDAGVPSQRLGAKLVLRARGWGPTGLELLDALLRTRPELYQVVHCSDRLTVLERLRDGYRVGLDEPMLQQVIGAGELLIARVLELQDCCLLDAVHGCLPHAGRRGMLRAARKAHQMPDADRLPMLLAAQDRAMARISSSPNGARDRAAALEATSYLRVRDRSPVEQGLYEATRQGVLRKQSKGGWVVSTPRAGEVGATVQLHDKRLQVRATSLVRAQSTARQLMHLIPGLQLGLTVLSIPSGVLL